MFVHDVSDFFAHHRGHCGHARAAVTETSGRGRRLPTCNLAERRNHLGRDRAGGAAVKRGDRRKIRHIVYKHNVRTNNMMYRHTSL
eukprot:1896375-Prymnesium_polylepis.1